MVYLGNGAQADQVIDEAKEFDVIHARYRAGPGEAGAAGGVYTEKKERLVLM